MKGFVACIEILIGLFMGSFFFFEFYVDGFYA